MTISKSSHEKIAKNTLVLYFRMAFTMLLSFYTTRIVIQYLGGKDFGLANVVGSIAMMFSFISGMLTASTMRFITVEISSGSPVLLKQIVNLIQIIFLALSIILFVLLESVGVWILCHYVDIPAGRRFESLLFFQFSIVTFLSSFLTIPFSSLVISHENMNYYAWISIADVVLRLGVLLSIFQLNHAYFLSYGAVLGGVAVFDFLAYFLLCYFRYPESHFSFYYNTQKMISFISYCGWSIWGALVPIFNNVFVNILLNNYFGAIVNAARGISQQILNGITGFCQNYLVAANPAIIKLFASGEYEKSYALVARSSRLCFFLLMLVAIPVGFEIDFILHVWLTTVPTFSVIFCRLVLIQTLIDTLCYPVSTLITARGKIALYQFVVGGTGLLLFPIAWIALRWGATPPSVYYIGIIISIVCFWLRLVFCQDLCGLRISHFLRLVLFPILVTVAASLIIPVAIYLLMNTGWLRFIIMIFAGGGSGIIAVWILGLQQRERIKFKEYLVTFLREKCSWLFPKNSIT